MWVVWGGGKVAGQSTGANRVINVVGTRSVATCRQHKVPISSRCRQLAKTDFTEFDYIIGQSAKSGVGVGGAPVSSSKANGGAGNGSCRLLLPYRQEWTPL